MHLSLVTIVIVVTLGTDLPTLLKYTFLLLHSITCPVVMLSNESFISLDRGGKIGGISEEEEETGCRGRRIR